MSHFIERKEKNCLNCGTMVTGRYCQNCGQENIEPKETAWHLITHFFNDFTHFDGKFFQSLKYLLFRPGLLSKEYMLGKRMHYLNPIRMYIFVSAVFFLVFFNMVKFNTDKMDFTGGKMNSISLDNDLVPVKKDTAQHNLNRTMQFAPGDYKNKEEYDSLLKAGVKKHNWLERKLTYKNIELNERYPNQPGKKLQSVIENFIHLIPQMLFVLLPFFALLLKLFYVRRKNFYYADHAIFTIHFYIFVFINLLLIFGLRTLNNMLHRSVLGWINTALIIWIFFYLYKAMRNFYGQSRGKTIGKYLLLFFSFIFVLFFVFAGFFVFSLLKV